MKILIVEDEPRMVELLQRGLTEEGHAVSCASDGQAALSFLRTNDVDMIVLDVMMPKLNGFEVAQRLRMEKVATPVLMLTARDSVQDIVQGLDLGADDYMTKPFSFKELLIRLQAIRRRACWQQGMKLRVGDLTLDSTTREVWREGERVFLTRREYTLLEHLMCRAGEVVSRQCLIETIWGPEHRIEDNTLDAFVRLLRHKVDCDGRSKLIHTVHGEGYQISAQERPE